MNIDVSKLFSNSENEVLINEVYSFSKEELLGTEIIRLDDLKVNGNIIKNSIDEIILNIIIEGTMVLPCAISLKEVNYDFECEISENIDDLFQKSLKNSENNQKTIDILPIIWENILMEIPIRVVSDDVSDVVTKGDGWELITEEAGNINPNLAKLKDLL